MEWIKKPRRRFLYFIIVIAVIRATCAVYIFIIKRWSKLHVMMYLKGPKRVPNGLYTDFKTVKTTCICHYFGIQYWYKEFMKPFVWKPKKNMRLVIMCDATITYIPVVLTLSPHATQLGGDKCLFRNWFFIIIPSLSLNNSRFIFSPHILFLHKILRGLEPEREHHAMLPSLAHERSTVLR